MGAYALGKSELKATFGTKDIVISPSKEPGHEHGWFNPDQFSNPLNVECHEKTTGEEIVSALEDPIFEVLPLKSLKAFVN